MTRIWKMKPERRMAGSIEAMSPLEREDLRVGDRWR
jgi:hypothetical protein